MALWSSERSQKQTDALVDRMVRDWKVDPADAREYVEGRGRYLRIKDVKKPDELKQFQRMQRWAATDGADSRPTVLAAALPAAAPDAEPAPQDALSALAAALSAAAEDVEPAAAPDAAPHAAPNAAPDAAPAAAPDAEAAALAAALPVAEPAAVPDAAQDAVPAAADHPLVGAWQWNGFPARPEPVPQTFAIFHADGTYTEWQPVAGQAVGIWRPTGARTADAVWVYPDTDPSLEGFAPGTATFTVAIALDAGGDALTATGAIDVRDTAGVRLAAVPDWTRPATRLTFATNPATGSIPATLEAAALTPEPTAGPATARKPTSPPIMEPTATASPVPAATPTPEPTAEPTPGTEWPGTDEARSGAEWPAPTEPPSAASTDPRPDLAHAAQGGG